MALERARAIFHGLQEVVGAHEARMSGAWSTARRLQYASRAQDGSGEGPFVEVFDWRWDGAFDSPSPLVGIAFLAHEGSLYWAKSERPAAQPAVSFTASGWAARPSSVSAAGSFHGAFPPSAPVEIRDEPPRACVLGPSTAVTGAPHLVAQLGGATFGVVLLPASAVKVGRNGLWHLRDDAAARLPPALRELTTRRRAGELT